METHVFIAILSGALLHAGWNSVVKVGLDRFSTILLLSYVQALIAITGLIFFVPLPSVSSLGWLVLGAFLHTGYKIFLIKAYERADLSQVYPVARGTAPLLVLLFSIFFLHESFSRTEVIAVLTISGGILVMALKGHAKQTGYTGLFFSLIAALFTASYTLADGMGARVAGTASGFILSLILLDTLNIWVYARTTRRVKLFPTSLRVWKPGFYAGAMSLAAYWITVWAFTQAPIALVASLREISILFATMIAVVILKEPVSLWRWVSACCIALGVIMMRH
ncbi:EamA-like transporter family protein [Vibrio aerogenes CECT 7868]|uniref:EamA-like transporter family protein n=1 Tax=Vibrio aerogenes CECT 7868 TaxID=1216006 RepID=A0A1M6A141_9VIBR|nr:DMT family transporter [Vibrio aerogenes]SHI30207.1 EamA-like transporter family protein [Vibrio aerogenes CECT 7868]